MKCVQFAFVGTYLIFLYKRMIKKFHNKNFNVPDRIQI